MARPLTHLTHGISAAPVSPRQNGQADSASCFERTVLMSSQSVVPVCVLNCRSVKNEGAVLWPEGQGPMALMKQFKTPADFWSGMVEPDFADCEANKADLRAAFHAAISLFHMHDWSG